MSRKSIILASGSLIRRKLMEDAGIDFSVISKPVDEDAIKKSMLSDGVKFKNIADALAEAKSIKVSQQHSGLVIGADQIMVMDNQLFDKPKTMNEAKNRLLSLRGKTHYLIGAIVISENGFPVWRHLAKTKLIMREFSETFLNEYLELEGKSILQSVGGYKFEGRGSQLFSNVEGDFFSILGLSMLPLMDYLRVRGALLS